MLQGLKLRDMAQQQGTTVEKIKVSGPAPQTVILLVSICPLPPAFLGHLRAACCALFLHICMYLRCASV
jgi:hypothetical protein